MDHSTYEKVIFIGETLGAFYLAEPTSEKIKAAFLAIKDLEVANAAKQWPFMDEQQAATLLAKMQESLAGLDFSGTIDSNAELTGEYRRLLVGPAPKPAPPWGSVYTDREMVIFGESTLKLRRWKHESGIERLDGNNTPEDHIGLMLLLMAWIAENKPELLEEYLRLHLLTWAGHFLDQFAQSANHGFYQALAQLTQDSLEGIQRHLQIDVEYPRFYR